MLKPFFKPVLEQNGIEVILPQPADMDFIHASIFDELGKGIFTQQTKDRYLHIINELSQTGAQGVIFACTEIPMLIKPEEVSLPVFDTTQIHVAAISKFVLQQ
jgi:aspartate racemase